MMMTMRTIVVGEKVHCISVQTLKCRSLIKILDHRPAVLTHTM